MFDEPDTAMHTGRFGAIHALVIVLSLAMTISAYLYSKIQTDMQVEARFNSARDQTVGLIADRMSRYEDALWSGVAHADTLDGAVNLRDWRAFATSLRIEEKYPGVNGIGVIFQVPKDEMPGFLADRAAEGWPLEVFPEHPFDPLLPITYLVPEAPNIQAIGLDVAHEENRRMALLASRDSGTAQITGPIVLVQDSGHTPGFLFYTPFYHGPTPTTVAERRARFAGVVYAPFVVRKLVEGVLAQDLRPVDFSIRDGDQVIYDEHSDGDATANPDPMFSDQVELELYGRTWVIDVRANDIFAAQNASLQPLFILFAGLIIEALIIVMLVMLVQANRKARIYADDLTRELRAKTVRLEEANEEIQRFVYVASHDLKTPVRGIGFLAESLEEDLEHSLGKLDDHPDLRKQLDMIRSRVDRMYALTNGIMAFSQVSADRETGGGRIHVAEVIADCVADFDLTPGQITLETDVSDIDHDAANFRSVLENLIGNAFKYHPDKPAARVNLQIRRQNGRLLVSVADNGKGIAPEFQDKIFEVFQTLRRPGDPDSTGIGLSIVKKAIERNGGQISVTSAEGAGATFTFDWPDSAALETSGKLAA